MDGRAFIRQALREVAERPFTNVPPIMSSKERAKLERQRRLDPSTATSIPELPPKKRIDHFVMNLPATAIEFLNAFKDAFQNLKNVEGVEALYAPGTMPKVHCHCFTRELERKKAIEDIREVRFSVLQTRMVLIDIVASNPGTGISPRVCILSLGTIRGTKQGYVLLELQSPVCATRGCQAMTRRDCGILYESQLSMNCRVPKRLWHYSRKTRRKGSWNLQAAGSSTASTDME